MKTISDVPTFDAFMQPIIDRLKVHGRSMTISEMVDDVSTAMGLSEEVRAVTHGKMNEQAVPYRIAWARSYLKKIGALENSERGVWSLTPKGASMTEGEVANVKRMFDYSELQHEPKRESQLPKNNPSTIQITSYPPVGRHSC